MKSKGRVVLGLTLAAVVAVAMTLAYAATKMPDKPIVIDSKGIWEKKKKSPVTFDHTKHKEFKCTQCHHEYKDGKNVWKEGQEVKKCSQCHKLKKEGKVVKLENAYHKQCKNCHKKLAKERGKDKAGPTTKCTGCHPKKKK
jgi:Ni/Co efflux regulator RcnB